MLHCAHTFIYHFKSRTGTLLLHLPVSVMKMVSGKVMHVGKQGKQLQACFDAKLT